jgi:DNA-binding MarR family transcriptional regulator
MLSGDGDHPMIKLSDTQAVILSAASQRDDGAVLPLPETLKLTGGALAKVLGSLKARGLIEHQGAPRGDDSPPLRITRAGLQAIGVAEDEPDSTPVPVTDAPQDAPDAQEARTAGQEPQAPAAAKRKAKKAGKPAKPAQGATGKPTPRAGTKQAIMIELLKRPEGATVAQIADATGWQNHTIRGAISGALKKKLKLNVEATRTREVGTNKTGAKGSTTVYRIVDRSAS